MAAETRLSVSSHRRRRTRSATRPPSGPTNEGAYTHTDTRPASLLLPVRDFTQMPATSDMALLPISEAAKPIKYSRPFLRARAFLAASSCLSAGCASTIATHETTQNGLGQATATYTNSFPKRVIINKPSPSVDISFKQESVDGQ